MFLAWFGGGRLYSKPFTFINFLLSSYLGQSSGHIPNQARSAINVQGKVNPSLIELSLLGESQIHLGDVGEFHGYLGHTSPRLLGEAWQKL